MEREQPVIKWEWTCSAAPSNIYKSFAPEVFPWNPLPLSTTGCRILHCPLGRTGRYLIFSPDVFLFLEILFCLLAIICCFQTCFVKPWYHWGVIGETASEVLLTWLQSITLTKPGLSPPAQPTGRVSARSLSVWERNPDTAALLTGLNRDSLSICFS